MDAVLHVQRVHGKAPNLDPHFFQFLKGLPSLAGIRLKSNVDLPKCRKDGFDGSVENPATADVPKLFPRPAGKADGESTV